MVWCVWVGGEVVCWRMCVWVEEEEGVLVRVVSVYEWVVWCEVGSGRDVFKFKPKGVI